MILASILLLACSAQEPVPSPSPSPAAVTEEKNAADAPSYPLGPFRLPDFLAAGEPFTLEDLRVDLSDTFRTTQAFAARFRFKDFGYIGAEAEGERRGVTLMTHRLFVSAFDENGSWDLDADVRLRRFVFSSVARGVGGDGALLEQAVAFRVTPALEAQAWIVGDTGRPDGRFLREATGFLTWQHGAALEASGQYTRAYESTAAGENQQDIGIVSLLAQVGPAELTGSGSLENTQGRFPRRGGEANGAARVSLAPRLLLEAGARGRFEAGAGTRLHEYRGALTWFARRFTLPRAGELGRRAVALARHATAAGEYELNAFDDDSLRAQRERLSLSPRRRELASDMEAVYRAQVRERPVPLAGLELRQHEDALLGETGHLVRGFLGVPWPPTWPWKAGEGSVPFLLLELSNERTTTATAYRAEATTVRFTVSLSREMDLVVRWTRTQPSALDIIHGVGQRRTFEVSYVYARGR